MIIVWNYNKGKFKILPSNTTQYHIEDTDLFKIAADKVSKKQTEKSLLAAKRIVISQARKKLNRLVMTVHDYLGIVRPAFASDTENLHLHEIEIRRITHKGMEFSVSFADDKYKKEDNTTPPMRQYIIFDWLTDIHGVPARIRYVSFSHEVVTASTMFFGGVSLLNHICHILNVTDVPAQDSDTQSVYSDR